MLSFWPADAPFYFRLWWIYSLIDAWKSSIGWYLFSSTAPCILISYNVLCYEIPTIRLTVDMLIPMIDNAHLQTNKSPFSEILNSLYKVVNPLSCQHWYFVHSKVSPKGGGNSDFILHSQYVCRSSFSSYEPYLKIRRYAAHLSSYL